MIIYYDGNCALCHNSVKIILKLDNKKKFYFSPLSLLKTDQKKIPDSIVLKINDKLFFEAQAIIIILDNLNLVGKIFGFFVKLIPLNFLNTIYRIVSKNRKRWKLKSKSQCPIIPDHMKSRFILSD